MATSLGLSAYFHFADAAKAAAANSGTTTAGTSAGSSSSAASAGSSAAVTPPAVGSAAAASGTGLADGTYLGATDTNRWGPVQVQITVTNGQITAVDAVQTPSENGKDIAINARATPILQSEALAAQSASIDGVSGATYTSNSYKVSLQSAIDQATAAGATA